MSYGRYGKVIKLPIRIRKTLKNKVSKYIRKTKQIDEFYAVFTQGFNEIWEFITYS